MRKLTVASVASLLLLSVILDCVCAGGYEARRRGDLCRPKVTRHIHHKLCKKPLVKAYKQSQKKCAVKVVTKKEVIIQKPTIVVKRYEMSQRQFDELKERLVQQVSKDVREVARQQQAEYLPRIYAGWIAALAMFIVILTGGWAWRKFRRV